ncbi:hypothetical protein HAX54_043167 [Datura stramonium]|uniref:Uncharacterized protein n=1 Tax=Datura stramonium TaxID=4076 RepID=A0ABS8W0H9_DATST|nr:hypothetical protein [Datura stramonium]
MDVEKVLDKSFDSGSTIFRKDGLGFMRINSLARLETKIIQPLGDNIDRFVIRLGDEGEASTARFALQEKEGLLFRDKAKEDFIEGFKDRVSPKHLMAKIKNRFTHYIPVG